MKKVLLALFVIVMLGYSAFTVYMVIGMQSSLSVEESVSEEVVLLCAAYAELSFEGLAEEYTEDGIVTEAFLEKLTEISRDKEQIGQLLSELQMDELQEDGHSAEQVRGRILFEAHAAMEDTVKLMVLDEDQYRAADLCNGVLAILEAADLSDMCTGMEIGEVGTEEYPVS